MTDDTGCEPPPRIKRHWELNAYRKVLLDYARMKLEEADWHGLADAAMDLRDLEAELKGLSLLTEGS